MMADPSWDYGGGSFRTMNPAQTLHYPKLVLHHETLVTSLSRALLLAAQLQWAITLGSCWDGCW